MSDACCGMGYVVVLLHFCAFGSEAEFCSCLSGYIGGMIVSVLVLI